MMVGEEGANIGGKAELLLQVNYGTSFRSLSTQSQNLQMKQSNFSHHLLSLYSAQQHCIWLSDCPQDPVLHTERTRPDGPRHDSSPTVDALNQELNQIAFEVEILPQGLPSQHQVHLQSLKISKHSSYVMQMERKVLTPSLPSGFLSLSMPRPVPNHYTMEHSSVT